MAGLCRSSQEPAAWGRSWSWSWEPAAPGGGGPGSAGERGGGGGRGRCVWARGGGIAAAGRGASGGGGESAGARPRGWVGRGAVWCLALGRLGAGSGVSLGSGTWPVVSLGPGTWPVVSLGPGSVGDRGIRTLGCFGTGTGPGPVVSLGTGPVGGLRTETPGHLGMGSALCLRRGSQGCGGTGSAVSVAGGGSTAVRGWPQWGSGYWLRAPLAPARSYHCWPARPVSTDLPRDVTLFQYRRPRFFRLLGLSCGAQALFWAYLAHFAFTSLRDTGYEETVLVGERAEGLPKIGGVSLNLGSDKWRYGFTASCLTVGCLILAAGSAFSRRSICQVVLHRGGQEVTISSHRLLGGSRSFRVPLRDLSCMAHRRQVASFIPLRVRGHRLYYLLDGRGQFHNPGLFDVTVGAYRSL